MVLPASLARRAAPWALSGAAGVHIVVRLWRATRSPALDTPAHVFLLRHADVILVLGGGPVVLWRLARASVALARTGGGPPTQPLRELRDVFTAALLGMNLLRRKLAAGKTDDAERISRRLVGIVRRGVTALEALDAPEPVSRSSVFRRPSKS